MERLVTVAREGSTSIVTMINPPVNVLSRALTAAVSEAWEEFNADPRLRTMILTGTGKTFIAGADIREIERITKREIPPDMSYLNALLNKIEAGPKPVIKAINGAALGIGLETAMAGHYRILKAGSALALPEVKLGLIPGAGGTQRLPRLAGIAAALRMTLSGEPMQAPGLIDEIVEGDPVERALAISVKVRRTCELPCEAWQNFESTGEERAPHRAVMAIKAAAQSESFLEGLAQEEALFRESLLDEQARAMVYLFFAEREAVKAPGSSQLPELFCETHPTPGKVVEVRKTQNTSAEDVAATFAYLKRQGKLPVVCLSESGWMSDWIAVEDARRVILEGMAVRPGDVDVVCVYGFGYPAHMGGPIYRKQRLAEILDSQP